MNPSLLQKSILLIVTLCLSGGVVVADSLAVTDTLQRTLLDQSQATEPEVDDPFASIDDGVVFLSVCSDRTCLREHCLEGESLTSAFSRPALRPLYQVLHIYRI